MKYTSLKDPSKIAVFGFAVKFVLSDLKGNAASPSPAVMAKNARDRANKVIGWLSDEEYVKQHSEAVKKIEAPLLAIARMYTAPFGNAQNICWGHLKGYHTFAIKLLKMPIEELQEKIVETEKEYFGKPSESGVLLETYQAAYVARTGHRYAMKKDDHAPNLHLVAQKNEPNHEQDVLLAGNFLPTASGLGDADFDNERKITATIRKGTPLNALPRRSGATVVQRRGLVGMDMEKRANGKGERAAA